MRKEAGADAVWTLATLQQFCAARGIALGMVVNLSNTARFYAPQQLAAAGIQVCHVRCEGHSGPPTRAQFDEFVGRCEVFWAQCPEMAIGVHCKHGYNRTGFMIASYLAERRELGPGPAMRAFAASRPPGIYKDAYVTELCRRHNVAPEPFLPAPQPAWRKKRKKES